MVESRSGQRQLSLDDVRDLIDVCWMAKRITEALPELPKNKSVSKYLATMADAE